MENMNDNNFEENIGPFYTDVLTRIKMQSSNKLNMPVKFWIKRCSGEKVYLRSSNGGPVRIINLVANNMNGE